MHIDDAIRLLKAEKKRGVQHIILSLWTADQFGRTDNNIWDYVSDAVMDADWGHINDTLDEMIEYVEDSQEICNTYGEDE